MSFNVETHHVLQFGRNVEFLLSQSGSRLEGLCDMGSYQGKAAAFIDQIGTIGVMRGRARLSDTPHMSITGDRRWVRPDPITVSTMLDRLDNQKMLIDLKSPYAQAVANALGCATDDTIGAAFFGTAYTGEMGTTPVTFPAGQAVGVNVGGANSGLNVPKLRAAKRLLMASGLDLARESIYCAITAAEHDNLLGELQVTNLDYNTKPTLVDGRVTQFLGFNFVHVEWQATMTDGTTAQYPQALATIAPGGLASTTRVLPVWVKSGVHKGAWDGVITRIDERADKNYAWQIYGEMTVGAARTQEKKVVSITCTSA